MLRKLVLIISVSLCSAVAVAAQGTAPSSSTAPASTSGSTAKKPAPFRPTKDQIKAVQATLKDKKLYAGEANGTYNDDTHAGIKSYQKDNGLNPTGGLNRATLEKMGVALTDAQKAVPASPNSFAKPETDTSTSKQAKSASSGVTKAGTGTLQSTDAKNDAPKKGAPFRATPDQIKAAQKILVEGKMYSGEQSGKLDDATREGLKKYQDSVKMKVTGTLNAATLEKMGIALTDKQKADAAASTTTQK